MSKNTKYNVVIDGTVTETRSNKATAVTLYNEAVANDGSSTIELVTSGGTVLETHAPRTPGHKPWTRTETYDGLTVEVPEGFTVAYKRTRVGAVVARANDKSGWLVITETGSTPAANTKEAREITNQLAADYKATQAEAKEADKAAKAEAKAAKAAAAAEAKAAKEAAKVAAAEAKAAAKAEKDAASSDETETVVDES